MIAIVDYNAGNLRSVKRACDAVGIASFLTQDPEHVAGAERVIFPGVGAAKSAMLALGDTGMAQAIREAFERGRPILGICLGAQIILERSEESDTPCLGLLEGRAVRFARTEPTLKIPHIGWNDVRPTRSHPLLEGLQPGDQFYFVHSYYPAPADDDLVFAVSDHGVEFCCALGRDNLFATQFHPEKSGRLGLELLERFSRWDGKPC